MYRWILPAFGLMGLPVFAQVPDPGVIAAETVPTRVAQNDPPPASLVVPAATPASSPTDNPLAPPPDPQSAPVSQAAPAPYISPAPAPNNLSSVAPATSPDDESSEIPTPVARDAHSDDGVLHDTVNKASVRPTPDIKEPTPAYFAQVAYLRKHNDNFMAVSYLRKILANTTLRPQYRARCMLELSDCLAASHQEPEALCWLKLWTEMYPSRPEIGAVAYRLGTMYTRMELPDLARDAYYLALAHTINQGEVQTPEDLKQYTRLTVGTLWALAANEYQAGQWARAAELFDRYRKEATGASDTSLEKAAFLQADCYYQARDTEKSWALYKEMLEKHPFNPLAPQARLRLYHLYLVKKLPAKAQAELEALVWTVRTVWPKDEAYWQRETARLLLALNQNNVGILPPVLQKSSLLPPEGKTWQETLNHYDTLVSYQAAKTNKFMDQSVVQISGKHDLVEEDNLLAMNSYMNQLLPPPRTAPSH
jgi:outer membrane protein assembly factor BamD (BamD/ComL family)